MNAERTDGGQTDFSVAQKENLWIAVLGFSMLSASITTTKATSSSTKKEEDYSSPFKNRGVELSVVSGEFPFGFVSSIEESVSQRSTEKRLTLDTTSKIRADHLLFENTVSSIVTTPKLNFWNSLSQLFSCSRLVCLGRGGGTL